MNKCISTRSESSLSLGGHILSTSLEETETCRANQTAALISRDTCPNDQISLEALVSQDETVSRLTRQHTLFLPKSEVIERISELIANDQEVVVAQIPDQNGDHIPELAFFIPGNPLEETSNVDILQGTPFRESGHLFLAYPSCETTLTLHQHFSAILMSGKGEDSQFTTILEISTETSCQIFIRPIPPICLPSSGDNSIRPSNTQTI